MYRHLSPVKGRLKAGRYPVNVDVGSGIVVGETEERSSDGDPN